MLALLGQVKILTTAFWSIALLGKKFDLRQCVALGMLTAGVGAVQVSQMHVKEGEGDSGSKNLFLGAAAILGAACCSGLAGVYFEKVLKGSNISLWVRNTHMAFFCATVGMGSVFVYEKKLVLENGFLAGFGTMVWSFVFTQAIGGLLIAAAIKYTDNIIKNFGSSLAIVVNCIVSMGFFGFPIEVLFLAGAMAVIYSMLLYGDVLHGFSMFKLCPRWLGGPPLVEPKSVEEGDEIEPMYEKEPPGEMVPAIEFGKADHCDV